MQEKIYAHAFNLIPKIGPQKIFKLLNYFSDFKNAWNASRSNLFSVGLSVDIIDLIERYRSEIDPEFEFNKINKKLKIITYLDDEYPEYLKQIPSAPFIIYIRGNTEILNKPSISIVGSRNMSDYGRRACEELSEQLSQAGLIIVSGLASGVDTIAHRACLKQKGYTIAVLGSGINDECIFPANNKQLVNNIENNNGAIISEYCPHFKAQRNFFPARNRIISGLSLGTIVIEAASRSGALITAYKALEHNKEVFAVPGSIYSDRSKGCNALIKKGAKLVQSVEDVIEELPLQFKIKINNNNYSFNKQEQAILNLITEEQTLIDELIKICPLPTSNIITCLTSLELKNAIKKNNNYIYKNY